MAAFMVHTGRNAIVGKFDSVSVIESIAKNAGFDAIALDGNLENIGDLTLDAATSVFNGLVPEDARIKGFSDIDAARTALRAALAMFKFEDLAMESSGGRAKDVGLGVLTDTVKAARRSSRLGKLIAALHEGGTLEELADAIDYPANRLWKDHIYSLKRRGYGREYRDGKFYLVMPAGMKAPLLR